MLLFHMKLTLQFYTNRMSSQKKKEDSKQNICTLKTLPNRQKYLNIMVKTPGNTYDTLYI